MPSAKSAAAANRCSMEPAESYDGFIFDYGGVLVQHQSESDHARMAALAGISADTFSELYWSDRHDYDKGILTGAEYWQHLATRAGALFTPAVIEQLTEIDSVTWMKFDTVMWDWIEELRSEKKRVAILSNMPRDLGETIKTRTDKFDRFDQVTLSYEVHSVKPEPAIYEHCLEGIETAPEKTLFLDDRIANVQGAELLGIRAVHFTSRDEVLLRLRA